MPDINKWYTDGKKSGFGAWFAKFKNKGRNPSRRSRHLKSQMGFFSSKKMGGGRARNF